MKTAQRGNFKSPLISSIKAFWETRFCSGFYYKSRSRITTKTEKQKSKLIQTGKRESICDCYRNLEELFIIRGGNTINHKHILSNKLNG